MFEAEDCVDLADFVEQFFAEALWQAAGDDDLLHLSFLFLFDGAAYSFECFCFGGSDEAASVNNDDVGVVGIFSNDEAGLCDLRQHPLAIDDIFGTAESDETDPSRPTSERAEAGSYLNFALFCSHRSI